jgi:hypothetical protein
MAKNRKYEQATVQGQAPAVIDQVVGITDAAQAPAAPPHRYAVELKYHERTEHAATSPEEAWAAYKARHGILASEWLPTITLMETEG